jgi:hypothetical protein
MAVKAESIVYKPEWNPTSQKFENICHFEKHKLGNKYICHCRHNDDTFKNLTEYKQHINHKYHEDWVKGYGKYANEEITKLTEEIKLLLKEKALLNAKLEKITAQLERDTQIFNKINKKPVYADCE